MNCCIKAYCAIALRHSLLLLLHHTVLQHCAAGVLELSYDAYTWDYAVIDAGLRGIHVTTSLDRFARLIALLSTCFLTAAVSDDPEVQPLYTAHAHCLESSVHNAENSLHFYIWLMLTGVTRYYRQRYRYLSHSAAMIDAVSAIALI